MRDQLYPSVYICQLYGGNFLQVIFKVICLQFFKIINNVALYNGPFQLGLKPVSHPSDLDRYVVYVNI